MSQPLGGSLTTWKTYNQGYRGNVGTGVVSAVRLPEDNTVRKSENGAQFVAEAMKEALKRWEVDSYQVKVDEPDKFSGKTRLGWV